MASPTTPGGTFDTHRYLEIWNAGVFMAYDKAADGTFTPLPFTSVDTGAGLERVQLAINGYASVYETDLLRPVVASVGEHLGSDLSERERRIVADHIRAATFILAEGVAPGNTGHGYIPRRLIRKCVAIALRHDRDPQRLTGVSDVVIGRMSRYYPHLADHRAIIEEALLGEIDGFRPTVERGLVHLEQRLAGLRGPVVPGDTTVSGGTVFDLVATYGLPLEIIAEALRARGLDYDAEAYQAAYRHHQEVSREGAGAHTAPGLPDPDLTPTAFTGYDRLVDTATITAILVDGRSLASVMATPDVEPDGADLVLITDRTPFYGEAGGQVGDSGGGTTPTGAVLIADTTRDGDTMVHHVAVTSGTVSVGQTIRLEVDAERRLRTARNHSATHLLQAALRDVLGDHVEQRGSLVAPDRLRFDFHHDAAHLGRAAQPGGSSRERLDSRRPATDDRGHHLRAGRRRGRHGALRRLR